MGTFGGSPFNPVDNVSTSLNSNGQIQATGTYNNPVQRIVFYTGNAITSGSGAPTAGATQNQSLTGSGIANYPFSTYTGKVYAFPIEVTTAGTLQTLGLGCTTTGSTNGKFRLGIYSGTSSAPTTLLAQTAEGTTSSSSDWQDLVITNQSLTASTYYWLAFTTNSETDASLFGGGSNIDMQEYTQAYGSLASSPTWTDAGQTGQFSIRMSYIASGTANTGDLFFRTDTPSTTDQRIYIYTGSAWSGIV